MTSKRSDVTHQGNPLPRFSLGWGASFVLGLITLVLGAIITARPTRSLTVIAVLLGVAMIVSGVFHIVRAIGGREGERVWRGISGVLFILAGLALIRHLHLSLALIGIFIGATWVIQGISTLMESFGAGRGRSENGWSIFFGVLSLIAGIVVISAPLASVAALTIFLGVWFIVLGFMEMLGAVLSRRARGARPDEPVDVPGPRSGSADASSAGASADSETPADHSRNAPH